VSDVRPAALERSEVSHPDAPDGVNWEHDFDLNYAKVE